MRLVATALLLFLAAWDGTAQSGPYVEWGTYLGGASGDYGEGIAVDGSSNVYATGYTSSSGWVSGGWDTTYSGTTDGYVVKLNAAGAHLWSTYLGGASFESGEGIGVDGSGNVYVTGYTESSGWVSGGWDTTYGAGGDGYVVKLTTGGAYVWSTYLGGASFESGGGIGVDGSGNVYATGRTSSSGWVSGGFDTTYNGGSSYGDAYLVKLSPAGTHLWSTYLGGASEDYGNGIAVDGSGNVYATGDTSSSGWVSGGWDTTYDGSWDGYIVKLTTGSAHVWSTYLGGASYDCGYGIAVDGSGNVYATGETSSSSWVSGGWDTSHNGSYDGYIVKLGEAGAHVWSTYLGGASYDCCYGIAVYGSGNVYATGRTYSSGWVSGGWDTTYGGGGYTDGYVVKLTTGGAHVWSTYLGGASEDYGYGIAVDGSGNIYATGRTSSSDWVSGGWDTTYDGGGDGFILKIRDGVPAPTFGAIEVTLSPQGAVSAGARWRRAGTAAWLASGQTESGLPVGSYTVEFRGVTGWVAPAAEAVTVVKDQTTQVTATYQPAGTGSVSMVIEPEGARTAGAQWRAANGDWLNSGATQAGIAPGPCTVEFRNIPGWGRPGDMVLTVTEGQTVGETVLYSGDDPEQAVIEGVVAESDGQGGARGPIIGATVSLEGGDSTITGSSGSFRFVGLAPDTYTVTASKTGYLPASRDVTVQAGKSRRQDLYLAIKPGGNGVPVGHDFTSPRGLNFIAGTPDEVPFGITVAWNGSPGTVRFLVNGQWRTAILTPLGGGLAKATLDVSIPSVIGGCSELTVEMINGEGRKRLFNTGVRFLSMPGIVIPWYRDNIPWTPSGLGMVYRVEDSWGTPPLHANLLVVK